MNVVKKEMIKLYKIKKLGYDFMGYTFENERELSYHHLIIAKQYCKGLGLGSGIYDWNGAILVQNTAHDYLHAIQRIDEEIFTRITNEMIEENVSNTIKIENLKKIRDLLLYFEYQYKDIKNSKGNNIIKEEYKVKRITL